MFVRTRLKEVRNSCRTCLRDWNLVKSILISARVSPRGQGWDTDVNMLSQSPPIHILPFWQLSNSFPFLPFSRTSASSDGNRRRASHVHVETPTAKENAACALLRLSQVEESKAAIGRSDVIPLLVSLLESGGFHAKKDASTALYSLCMVKENKIRAVKAGIMKVLVELMADFESNMVDKSAYMVSMLVAVLEARAALVEEGGVPVLVEIVEVGTQRQKEIVVVILLQVCEDSVAYRTMVAREGAIPPLVSLSQSGTNRAKQKAEKLIELLRPRSGYGAVRTSEVVA
ncbi:U-box domain-containing protein 3 [Glycine soja]|uniref:U-box domain-containing protein 3 n=1 Tax=Glycine soja TaxID=3848 RepID=A0A0B2PJB4_GLYSO|nr:U-box domain-containing protein 3 [Glycine soja]